MMKTLLMICALFNVGYSGLEQYNIYIGSRPLIPLIVYSKPPNLTYYSELEPIHEYHIDVPSTLCGVSYLSPKYLLASMRCSPRSPTVTDIYLYNINNPTDENNLYLIKTAKIIRGAVTDVQFYSKYNSTLTGTYYYNIAVLQLNTTAITEEFEEETG